jgi:drug/metabolite transporter (DMT)-like permease
VISASAADLDTSRNARASELGWLLVLATLWGGSYTLIKVAVETVPPFTVVAVRVTIAALLGLAVFSTALASSVYFRLLRTLGSIGTTSNSYLRAGASVVLGSSSWASGRQVWRCSGSPWLPRAWLLLLVGRWSKDLGAEVRPALQSASHDT